MADRQTSLAFSPVWVSRDARLGHPTFKAYTLPQSLVFPEEEYSMIMVGERVRLRITAFRYGGALLIFSAQVFRTFSNRAQPKILPRHSF